jgi:Transposase zinc-binding domain
LSRPAVEVADIFRRHGPAWRNANVGHVSLDQLKVMSAIENCRTAALGGHVECCEDCAHVRVAYNSCRDRHCPKCQAIAAKEWLAEREAELLPVPYFHVVFTLPASIADIAWQNKAVIYDMLFKAAAETLVTIAADPKRLGARIGLTAVLHTWGSALTHHPLISCRCRWRRESASIRRSGELALRRKTLGQWRCFGEMTCPRQATVLAVTPRWMAR